MARSGGPIRRSFFLLSVLTIPVLLGGCPFPVENALTGTWILSRGALRATFTFTAADGDDVLQRSDGNTLEPVDPEAFPEALRPLAESWNQRLSDVNAAIEAALPDQVTVSFPQPRVIRVADAANASSAGSGLINEANEFVFIGDLSGDATGDDTGGGVALELATITGSFEDTDRLSGRVTRIQTLASGQGDSAVILTIDITVEFTGERS